jgi:hypothetical protein
MNSKINDLTQYANTQENRQLDTKDSQEVSSKSDSHIIAKKQHDFSSFKVNNWRRMSAQDNKVLEELDKLGAAIWLSPEGTFYFRRSFEDTLRKLEPTKMKTVLCNILDRDNLNIFTAKDESIDIIRNELLMCEDRFTPFVNSEFYRQDGMWFRTAFKPTHYLKINTEPENYRKPTRILWLMEHLCNHNRDYFNWFINWIACFFQTLEKSQVSLLLKGAQGTGKGILFERVLAPLFGETYCVVVDDDRLGSSFKNWVDNTLFYNLNEISHDMRGRKSVKNFIKMLVTDRSIQTEKKYENASKTEIFGNVLITSNENYPIEVEPSDCRFTVFGTGCPLKEHAGLNISELLKDIQDELESFAWYLKNYPCDKSLYHTPLDTPEKQALIDGTTDRFTLFVRALVHKDLDYFSILEEEESSLYHTLEKDFEKERICQSDLKLIYDALFDDNIPSKTLLGKLRAIEPLVFPSDRKKLIKSNGKYYYSLKQ